MAKVIARYSVKEKIGVLGLFSERIFGGSWNGGASEDKNKIKKRMEKTI
jgi:hypothetical protein